MFPILSKILKELPFSVWLYILLLQEASQLKRLIRCHQIFLISSLIFLAQTPHGNIPCHKSMIKRIHLVITRLAWTWGFDCKISCIALNMWLRCWIWMYFFLFGKFSVILCNNDDKSPRISTSFIKSSVSTQYFMCIETMGQTRCHREWVIGSIPSFPEEWMWASVFVSFFGHKY